MKKQKKKKKSDGSVLKPKGKAKFLPGQSTSRSKKAKNFNIHTMKKSPLKEVKLL